jgi:hypothetical protein
MLGATDFNPYVKIMTLKAEHKMLTITFITKAQDIRAQLVLSSHPVSNNNLFKQFLQELMKTNLHSYVSNFFLEFNNFSKASANMEPYTKQTIDTVSWYLIDGKAPEVLFLTDKVDSIPNHDVNDPSPFNNAHVKHRSRSNFSRPKFAAMQLESSELVKENEVEANDDGTVDEEFECTEEGIRAAEEQVAPYFDKIMETYTGNADSLHKELVFTAMETIKQSRKQCEVCTETHPADRECWYRGAEFQPDWLQKRVEQVNMRDGNKPKNDPNHQVISPKASLSRKPPPQYQSMQLSSNTSDEANALLNKIKTQLQANINNDSLSPVPMMPSLKISTSANAPSDAPSTDGQANILPSCRLLLSLQPAGFLLSPIHDLPHETPNLVEASMFCVDSSANMFVGNQKQHFSHLIMKKIGVELGTSSQGYFEGVGVIAVSFPTYRDEIFFLYPVYYSSNLLYRCSQVKYGIQQCHFECSPTFRADLGGRQKLQNSMYSHRRH